MGDNFIFQALNQCSQNKKNNINNTLHAVTVKFMTVTDIPLNVLILCEFNFCHIGTVSNHLEAFKLYSRNNVFVLDSCSTAALEIDLNQFDIVVLHYSLVILDQRYIPMTLVKRLRAFVGYKVLFIQDEYRGVDSTVEAISDLGIHLIYSVINEDTIDAVYHHQGIRHVRRKTTLTGFVPEQLTTRSVPDYQNRPIDVGYRARRAPSWLGYFAQEKWLIGEHFKRDAKHYGLVYDIECAENKRLYGEKWVNLITNCKAMLGTESGASFIDFSGAVQAFVEDFELANPEISFEEIREQFLEGRDGDITIHVISPRSFEAAALRTLMILYPGSYSGILEPWRHYVPLERDHSNIDEVVTLLRDPGRAQEIIDAAYYEVAMNPAYSFRSMVETFDNDLVEHRAEILDHRPVSVVDIETLTSIEHKVERYYRLWRRPVEVCRQLIYSAIHWLIKKIIPIKSQRKVVVAIKRIVCRIGLLKIN